MLELKNLKKDYPAGDDTVHALKGIDLQFRKSEFVSILGPSGCGKTTMLNIIGGLDKYTDGDLILFPNQPIDKVYRLIPTALRWVRRSRKGKPYNTNSVKTDGFDLPPFRRLSL